MKKYPKCQPVYLFFFLKTPSNIRTLLLLYCFIHTHVGRWILNNLEFCVSGGGGGRGGYFLEGGTDTLGDSLEMLNVDVCIFIYIWFFFCEMKFLNLSYSTVCSIQ